MGRLFGSTLVGLLLWSTVVCSHTDPRIDRYCEGDESLAKMTSELLRMRMDIKSNKAAPKAAIEKYAKDAIRQGQLQCIIGLDAITDEVRQACASAGVQIVLEHSDPANNYYAIAVRCSNPLQLDSIARRGDVRGITSEPAARSNAGRVTSQADSAINADTARATYGVDGFGIRVGVLSDSFSDTRQGTIFNGFLLNNLDQLSGDLPPSIRIIDPGFGDDGSDEGNGMAQLIYDLAPRCEISFASAFSSYLAFANNITALRTDPQAPADVIVDDVIYFNEPVYQNGPIAIAANRAFNAGVPYFSSAGNSADEGHEAPYFDTDPTGDDVEALPTGKDLHDFGLAKGGSSDTHLQFTITPPGGVFRAVLHWDEPYGGTLGAGPGAESDLDMYVVTNTSLPLSDGDNGNVFVSSKSIQGTEGAPQGDSFEFIGFGMSVSSPQTFHLVIEHVKGRDPSALHLWIGVPGTVDDEFLLGDRTIWGHAAAEHAHAVAAMDYREIFAGGDFEAPLGPLDVESFSSLGGNLPFYYSDDGLTRYDTPETRFKPEITAPDGTDTTFFGSTDTDATGWPNFYGTSAAAPHAAAVAALMLQLKPILSPQNVYDFLRASTEDAEENGPDFLSGDGLINALWALGLVSDTPITPLPTSTPIPEQSSNALLYGAQPSSGLIVVVDPDTGEIVNNFVPPEDAPLDSVVNSWDGDIGLTMGRVGRSLYYQNADTDPDHFYELDPKTGEVRKQQQVYPRWVDRYNYDEPSLHLAGLAYYRPDYFTENAVLLSSSLSDGLEQVRVLNGDRDTFRFSDWRFFGGYWWRSSLWGVARAVGGDDTRRAFGTRRQYWWFFDDYFDYGTYSIMSIDPLESATPEVQFAAPNQYIEGLAFNGSTLFASDSLGNIFHLSPTNGTIKKSVVVQGGGLYGLAVGPRDAPVIVPGTHTPSPVPTWTPTRTNTVFAASTPTRTPTVLRTPTPTLTPRILPSVSGEPVDSDPIAVAVGELDGANYDDIVTANYRSDTISLLFNDGTGQFSGTLQTIPIAEGSKPASVVIGDLDDDGLNDLLVVTVGDSKLWMLKNLGSGQFDSPMELALEAYRPLAAFVGDLNGDDKDDIAVANSETDNLTVALWTNGAKGLAGKALTTATVPVGGKMPNSIAQGIFRPATTNKDLVTCNWEDDTVSVLLGNGDGSFQSAAVYDVSTNPRDVAVADMDSDGFDDIIVASQGAPQANPPVLGKVTILLNDGNGVFDNRAPIVVAAGGDSPASLAAVDFDGDPDASLDLAVVNLGSAAPPSPGDLVIVYNDPANVGSSAQFAEFDRTENIGFRPISIAVGGLDSTIKDDLVVANQQDGTVGIITVPGQPKEADHADLNRDGFSDNLDLFFLSIVSPRSDPLVRGLADLNGDGVLDERDLLVYLKLRTSPVPAPGNLKVKASGNAGSIPKADPAAGDLNGDGVVNFLDALRQD